MPDEQIISTAAESPVAPEAPKQIPATKPQAGDYSWTSGNGDSPAPIRSNSEVKETTVPEEKHDPVQDKTKNQVENFIDLHTTKIIDEYKGLKSTDDFQSLIKDQAASPFSSIAPTAESYYNQNGGITTVTPEGDMIETNLSPQQKADLKQTDKEFLAAGKIPAWKEMKGKTVQVGTLISVDDDFKKGSSTWYNKLLGDNQNSDGSYAWDGKYLQMRYDEGTGKVVPLPFQPFRKLAEAGADVGESETDVSAAKPAVTDQEAGQWLEGQTGRETGKDTRPITDEMTKREGSELWRKYPTAARVKDVLSGNLPLTKLLMGNEKLFNAFKDELDNASGNQVVDQFSQKEMLSKAIEKVYGSDPISKEVSQAADAASRLPAIAQQFGKKQKDLAAQMKIAAGNQPEFTELAILETKMAVKPKEVTEDEAARYRELNELVSQRIAEAGKGTKEYEQYISNRTAYAQTLKSVAKAINVFTEPGRQKELNMYLTQRKGAELEGRLSNYFPELKKTEQKQEELDRKGSATSFLRGGYGALIKGIDNLALYLTPNDKMSAALASHLTNNGRPDMLPELLTPNRQTVNADGTPNYLNEVLNTLDSGSKMVGSMLPAMAAGATGGGAAEIFAFGAMAGQEAKDEGIRQGMKSEDAATYGLISGLITGAAMKMNLPSSWLKQEAKGIEQLVVDGFSHKSVLDYATKLLVPTGKDATHMSIAMGQAAAMEIANSVTNQAYNEKTGSKLETVTADKLGTSMAGMATMAYLFTKVGKAWEMGSIRPMLYKSFREAPQETLEALGMARKKLLLDAANGDPKAAGALNQIDKAHQLLTEYAMKKDMLLPSTTEDQHDAQALVISNIADLKKRRAEVGPELHEILDDQIEVEKKKLKEVVADPEKASKVIKKSLDPVAKMQEEVTPKPEAPQVEVAPKIFSDLDHTITTSDTDNTLTPWGEELKQKIASGEVKAEDVHIVSKNPDVKRAQKIAKELGIPIENVATGLETPEAKAEYIKSAGGGENDIFVDDRADMRDAAPIEAVHPDEAAQHKESLIQEVRSLAGEVKGFYKGLMGGEHTEEALHEIAQQLHSSPDEANSARAIVGDRIADIAEELFPDIKVGDKFAPDLITPVHVEDARGVLETAQKKLAKALKDVEKTQSNQSSIFGGEQTGMFGMGREEAKKVLDPLRDAVKDARQKYEDIKKKFQVQEDAANPDLFEKKEPEPEPDQKTLKQQIQKEIHASIKDQIAKHEKRIEKYEALKEEQGKDLHPEELKKYMIKDRKRREKIEDSKNEIAALKKVKTLLSKYDLSKPNILSDISWDLKAEEAKRKGSKKQRTSEQIIMEDAYNKLIDYVREAKGMEPRKDGAGEGAAQAEAKKVYADFNRVADQFEPMDAYSLALHYIAGGGKVGFAAIREVAGHVKRAMLNVGRREVNSEEINARDYADVNGKTLDGLAHDLWENRPDESELTPQDLKEALMDVIRDHPTRLEAAKSYIEMYDPEAAEKKYWQEKADEIEAEDKRLDQEEGEEREQQIKMAQEEFESLTPEDHKIIGQKLQEIYEEENPTGDNQRGQQLAEGEKGGILPEGKKLAETGSGDAKREETGRRIKEYDDKIADSKDPEEIAHLEKQKELINKYGMTSEEIKAKLEDEGKLKVKCPPGAKRRFSLKGLFKGAIKAATGLVTGKGSGKWEVVSDIKGDPHSKGGVDITVKGQPVEAEGKELRLKSTDGTEAIIPKDRRKEVLTMIEKGEHGKIANLISELPKMPGKAEDGGVFGPGDPPTKLATFRKLVVQEARNRSEKGAQAAYNLSEKNAGKGLDNDVCIGGISDIYNSQGFKFAKTPNTVQSRGGSTTYEYNRSFANEYKNQGFEIANDAPQEGDMIQYLDNKDSHPYHMNMVTGVGKDGKSMEVFNAYRQKMGYAPIYEQKLKGDRVAINQDGEENKFVVYRPTEAALKGIDENSVEVKKALSNYDIQSKYEAAKGELNGVKVGADKKLTFTLKNGKEVKSEVTAEEYKAMDKLGKINLWQSILNKK